MQISRRCGPAAGSGLLALLALVALVGCGSATGASAAATPTCPAHQQGQAARAVGTLTIVSAPQMTLQTATGQVNVTLANTPGFARLEAASRSALQDGQEVEVGIGSNSDGSYTAQMVIILPASANGAGKGSGGNPGGGTGDGNSGGKGSASLACSGKSGKGRSSGLDLLNGQQGLSGVVATVSGQSLMITDQGGNDYTLRLEPTTTYASLMVAHQSDLRVGQTVEVIGLAQSDGSIAAEAVLILPRVPAANHA